MDDELTFGQWLRRQRKAHDLTQAELARKVDCAVGTIRKLEADELRPSKEIAARLAMPLGVPEAERASFVAFARGLAPGEGPHGGAPSTTAGAPGKAPPRGPTDATSSSEAGAVQDAPPRAVGLPIPLTPFIGREREVAAVRQELLQPAVRLLTLVGPGGTGKTRLALEVVAVVTADFVDGVVFVDLAPVADAGLVPTAIVQALGLRQSAGESLVDLLIRALGERRRLLVLDNFEQVLPAASMVAEVLRGCPRLKILVTSRARLGLSGEHAFTVPPMRLPAAGEGASAAQLLEVEAARLFVERAQAAQADFEVTDANAPVIAAICTHLDGLPLALELAAARITLLEPHVLLRRLEQRLRLLIGGPRDLPMRQQTMRAAIDWSYNLLAPTEQRLFTRLAVFVGGWTLEAAEAVCDADGDLGVDVLDGLQSLVDKSLVRLERAQAPATSSGAHLAQRFRRLETIREYARERLMVSEESETLQRCHVAYYLHLVEAVALPHLPFHERDHFNQLEHELDNLRVALQWALDREEAEIGLRLATALGDFWAMRYPEEGLRWIEAALAPSRVAQGAQATSTISRDVYAAALMSAGYLSFMLGGVQSRARLEEAVGVFQELDDRLGSARSLLWLGYVADSEGDVAGARRLCEDSLRLFREVGSRSGVAAVLNKLAYLALHVHDYALARAYGKEALVLSRELGSRTGMVSDLIVVAGAARDAGDYAEANKLFEEALAIAQRVGEQVMIGHILHAWGELALLEGDPVALAHVEGSLAHFQAAGHRWGIAFALHNLGYAAQQHADTDRMAVAFRESLQLACNHSLDKWLIAACVAGLAGVAAVEAHQASECGNVERAHGAALRAGRLFGAAGAIREAASEVWWHAHRILAQRNMLLARPLVHQAAWETAWAEGYTMTPEEALAYAREQVV